MAAPRMIATFVLSTRQNRAPFGSLCQSLPCSSSARRTKRGSALRFGHLCGLWGLTAPLCAQKNKACRTNKECSLFNATKRAGKRAAEVTASIIQTSVEANVTKVTYKKHGRYAEWLEVTDRQSKDNARLHQKARDWSACRPSGDDFSKWLCKRAIPQRSQRSANKPGVLFTSRNWH